MTTNKHTMALAELAEKGADVDLLREMIQFVAQRLTELDVETLCGAGYGERTAERINHRNGYRPRLWDTRAGLAQPANAAKAQPIGGGEFCWLIDHWLVLSLVSMLVIHHPSCSK